MSIIDTHCILLLIVFFFFHKLLYALFSQPSTRWEQNVTDLGIWMDQGDIAHCSICVAQMQI